MTYSRQEAAIDKMRYDIHEGVKQLKRIADALERAYPKRKLEDATDEDTGNPPQRTEPWGGM